MKYFEREANSRSDSWGTCVPARMMLRAGDGDDGVDNGGDDDDKAVVGRVGTREEEEVTRFMFS